MPLRKNKNLKIFSSIGEVARELGLNESTIRYWEKEFDVLRPPTGKNGARYYRKEDVNIIRKIKFLVKEQKMTLEGAREKLKDKGDKIDRQIAVLKSLENIKAELLSLKAAFDTASTDSEQ
jgi:DNA-binding transcriptional MerR regulator